MNVSIQVHRCTHTHASVCASVTCSASVCMYVHMCVCAYMCVHVCLCVHVCVCMHVCVSVCACMCVCMCSCMFLCVRMCPCICLCEMCRIPQPLPPSLSSTCCVHGRVIPGKKAQPTLTHTARGHSLLQRLTDMPHAGARWQETRGAVSEGPYSKQRGGRGEASRAGGTHGPAGSSRCPGNRGSARSSSSCVDSTGTSRSPRARRRG